MNYEFVKLYGGHPMMFYILEDFNCPFKGMSEIIYRKLIKEMLDFEERFLKRICMPISNWDI
jgi:hypothetical protein